MQAAAGLIRCAFCAEQIQPDAAVCRHCGRALPYEMTRALQIGRRWTLGELRRGGYGIWDLMGGPHPVYTYPQTPDAWYAAIAWFREAETQNHALQQRPAYAPEGGHVVLYTFIGLLLLVVIIYYALHSHKYQACLVEPSLFSWPSTCL